ncbi:hypothetical protein [Mesorhizobium sp. Cs1299R1N3]|uniref:hypothetical protein n=1 Tax=Mesorhizobium sp. Cs1299R1N3 TaxID=3015173 RepID=UPI00301C45EA
MPKLTDKTLGEAALNPDGKTYHGPTAVRWMMEALTGKPFSAAEADKLIAEAQERAKAKRNMA